MGFGRELKDFAEGFRSGSEIATNAYKARTEWEKTRPISEKDIAGQGEEPVGGDITVPTVQDPTGKGGGDATNYDIQWSEASPEQRAFLNALAGPESGGEYNIIYGGDHFEDYSKHPGKYITIESGPNKGKKSSAAGKYQFLESTWNDIAGRYNLKDFSPANQDQAAWILAAETYAQKTKGGKLLDTLKSGDAKQIAEAGKILSPIWTSLPSGIEQGQDEDKFVTAFNTNLQRATEQPDQTTTASTGALPEPGEGATRPQTEPTSGPATRKEAQALFIDPETAKQMDPDLVKVAERAARDNPGLFAFNPKTKTIRTEAEQREMVKKGWSKTMKSKHREGKALDLVPINPETREADPDYQEGYSKISDAMRKAAEQEGIKDLKWGGDWKSFVDKPHWEVSMLEQQQQDQALQPGGITEPEQPEEEFAMQPTMFAQEGGVIPEPEQVVPPQVDFFAAGGMPKGMADARTAGLSGGKFVPNMSGTATSAAAGGASNFNPRSVGGGAAFQPRRVGEAPTDMPAASAMKMEGGLTPSQAALKKAQDNLASERKAAADKLAADKAAAEAKANAVPQYYKPTSKQQMYMMFGEDPRSKKFGKDAMTDEQWKSFQSTPLTQGYRGWQNPLAMFGVGSMGNQSRGGSHFQGGMVGMQEGGVIPEPGEIPAFARGGRVADRDAQFQEFFKQESRRGDIAGESARDRAAKRLSALEGRPTSSAYRPSTDDEYFEPATPRKGKPAGGKPGKTDPIKTGSTDEPKRVIHPPNPKVGKPEPAKAATGMTYPEKMGTAAQDAIDAAGPPKESPAKAAGTDVTGYEPEPVTPIPDLVTDPRTGYKFNPETGSLVSKPEYGSPGAEPPPAPVAVPEPPPPETPIPPLVTDPRSGYTFNPESGSIAGTPNYGSPGGEPPAAPAPAAAPAAAPVEPANPNHAAMIQEARQLIASGQISPQEIGEKLKMLGLPETLWPIDIQKAVLGFQYGGLAPDPSESGWNMAAGGVIPEPGQPGYNEAVAEGRTAMSAVDPAERDTPAQAAQVRRQTHDVPPPGTSDDTDPERADVRPKPQLLSDVRQALDGGVRFLQRHFNIGNEGAVPTPEDEATTETGSQRFAKGEGAATVEEIEEIDNQVDPNRELAEGHRQMVRLGKTMRWYQSRGRKDEAEAAAASYMQYGAQRFSKLGSLAQVAYQNGDVEKTVQYLEKAYEMIPDGAQVNVRVNESTGKLEGVHVDENGEEEYIEVSPDEIPGLLRSVQDKSRYWDAIFRLADPEGAKSKDIEERGIREEQRAEKRALGKEGRELERELAQEGREGEREIAKEGRAAKQKEIEDAAALEREKAKEVRQAQIDINQKLFEKSLSQLDKDKPAAGEVDMNVVSPLLAGAEAAKQAYADDNSPENKVLLDTAYSRLFKAVNGDAKWMLDNEFDPGDFQYRDPDAAAAEGVATSEALPEGAPAGTKRGKHPKTGEPIWFAPDPNSPSGFSIVAVE